MDAQTSRKKQGTSSFLHFIYKINSLMQFSMLYNILKLCVCDIVPPKLSSTGQQAIEKTEGSEV